MTSADFSTGLSAAIIARAMNSAPEDKERVSAMLAELAELEARIKSTDSSIIARTAEVSERQRKHELMYASLAAEKNYIKLLDTEWINATIAESTWIGEEIKSIRDARSGVGMMCHQHKGLMNELAKIESPSGSIHVSVGTDTDGRVVPTKVVFEKYA
jgi:dsDNA-specific endonuclease/ATPase MutS2